MEEKDFPSRIALHRAAEGESDSKTMEIVKALLLSILFLCLLGCCIMYYRARKAVEDDYKPASNQ